MTCHLRTLTRPSQSETLMYDQQQNKWYPHKFLLALFEATLHLSRTEFTCPYKLNHNLLWASKFATPKPSKALKWASKHHRGTIYFAVDGAIAGKTNVIPKVSTCPFRSYTRL